MSIASPDPLLGNIQCPRGKGPTRHLLLSLEPQRRQGKGRQQQLDEYGEEIVVVVDSAHSLVLLVQPVPSSSLLLRQVVTLNVQVVSVVRHGGLLSE